MAEKAALVSGTHGAYGLGPSLRAVELARSTWYHHTRTRVPYAEKYAHLEAPLKAIAEAHPEYGYRRTAAELRETYGHRVNRKVVARLHRLWDLPLRRTVTRPKPSAVRRAIDAAGPRANLLSGRPKAEMGPLEVFYTDFTELVHAGGTSKAWLIPILDHATKYVPGFAVGASADSGLALSAWTAAERTLARLRHSLDGIIVHQDRDPVFTGYAWTRRLLSAGARLSYALRGPRDNPEMESFFGRFKVENRSLILDAGSVEELAAVVRDRINYYNRVRRHSSLGDRPPMTIIEDLYREG